MLPNYLANIKSSGMYRFVWDKSEVQGTPAQILRLVVGYSEKGPFNTPVYITKDTEFKQIFGGTSKKLERYGVWFHRLALQALKAGPILALNLKNFETEDDTKNRVEFTSFNPNESIFNMNGGEILENLDMTVKQLYNTDRFWRLEPEDLENLETEGIIKQPNKQGYITITSTDSKETSTTIFMRGYQPRGYDVPFKEWYSAVLNGEELPTYLEGHENDLVSQYFAEMFIFKGKFTPQVASSDKLSKFFDVNGDVVTLKPYITNAFGERIDTLDALAANDASNFIKSYSGILLPDFRNANNTVISLDAQVNADNYTHKLMMRLNQDMLYNIELPDEDDPTSGSDFQLSDIDTTGWTFGPEPSNQPMMSVMEIDPVVYRGTFENGQWNYTTDEAHEGLAADYYGYDNDEMEAAAGSNEYTLVFHDDENRFGHTGIQEGDTICIMNAGDKPLLTHVVKIDIPEDEIEHKYKYDGTLYNTLAAAAQAAGIESATVYKYNGTSYTTKDAAAQAAGLTPVPDAFKYGDTLYETRELAEAAAIAAGGTAADVVAAPDTWKGTDDALYVSLDAAIEGCQITIAEVTTYTYDGNTYNTLEAALNAAQVEIEEVAINTYYVQFDRPVAPEGAAVANYDLYKCVGSVTATSAGLRPLYLEGFTFDYAKPKSTTQNDKLDWQHHILDALVEYRGLRLALTNRVDIAYRYLVDTFEGFVEAEEKAKLSSICKGKDNVFGILNFPLMKSFSKCKYVSFRNEKNEFDTKYIPQGGNALKPMSCMFTLASEENGASWAGWFTGLAVRDPNTGVREEMPSAALVSNDFMAKYSKYLPYTVIAGPNRARITEPGLIGPDFNFSREDLDNLEPMGVNCMVYEPRKGTYINSNQTGKQNPVTGLSKINVRELCIFLQDEIEQLMTDYHWDFNTPNLQQRVKDRADVICGVCKANEGVYDFENTCDESNNTNDVVDNELFILSTSIEPTKGAGKMVQELTIYRKGGMSARYIDA